MRRPHLWLTALWKARQKASGAVLFSLHSFATWFHFTGLLGSSVSYHCSPGKREDRLFQKYRPKLKHSLPTATLKLDAFVRLARSLESFSTNCSFGGWGGQVQERKDDVLTSKWGRWVHGCSGRQSIGTVKSKVKKVRGRTGVDADAYQLRGPESVSVSWDSVCLTSKWRCENYLCHVQRHSGDRPRCPAQSETMGRKVVRLPLTPGGAGLRPQDAWLKMSIVVIRPCKTWLNLCNYQLNCV